MADRRIEELTVANRALREEVLRARDLEDRYRYHYSSHVMLLNETQELKRELSDLKQEKSDLKKENSDLKDHINNKVMELEALERVADLIKEEKPLVGVEELAEKVLNPNAPMRAQQQQEYVSILSTSPGYVRIQKELEEAYEMEKQKREKMKDLQSMVDDFIAEHKVQFPPLETKQGPSI